MDSLYIESVFFIELALHNPNFFLFTAKWICGGKPLRSAEIIPLLKDRQPEIVKKQDSLEKYISAFLNTAIKQGRLVPYKLKGVRGNFYCLPEWIDEDGELRLEMKEQIY